MGLAINITAQYRYMVVQGSRVLGSLDVQRAGPDIGASGPDSMLPVPGGSTLVHSSAGILRLDEAGFTPYLRLPIHDEVLASVPAEHAAWGAREIGRLMAEEMGPVFIGTDPEVGGRSWGSLYGADF